MDDPQVRRVNAQHPTEQLPNLRPDTCAVTPQAPQTSDGYAGRERQTIDDSNPADRDIDHFLSLARGRRPKVSLPEDAHGREGALCVHTRDDREADVPFVPMSPQQARGDDPLIKGPVAKKSGRLGRRRASVAHSTASQRRERDTPDSSDLTWTTPVNQVTESASASVAHTQLEQAADAGDFHEMLHVLRTGAAVLESVSAQYQSQRAVLERAATQWTEHVTQVIENAASAVEVSKRAALRKVADDQARTLNCRIDELRARASRAQETIEREDQWRQSVAKLLSKNLEQLRQRADRVNDQTRQEHDELALIQQQTSALFDRQAQITLDVAALETTQKRIQELLEENHSVTEQKSQLADQIANVRDGLEKRVDRCDRRRRDLELESRRFRAKIGVVQRRVDAQKKINDALQRDLTAVTTSNESLTEELEDLRAEYAVREAQELRAWTPRPSTEPLEAAGVVVSGKTTANATEAAMKRLQTVATNARRACEELVKIGRVVAPLMDLGVCANASLPPVLWRFRETTLSDSDDEAESPATEHNQKANKHAPPPLMLDNSVGPLIPPFASGDSDLPNCITGTPAVQRPRWKAHVTEAFALATLKALAHVAAGNYLNHVAAKEEFTSVADGISFKISEAFIKAASTSLQGEITSILQHSGFIAYVGANSGSSTRIATRVALMRLVLACEHYASHSDICGVLLRVLGGTLPLSIAEFPLAALGRVVSHTQAEGAGMASIKAVFLSLTREFGSIFGTAELIRLRYATMIDAATSGNGSSAQVRLAALNDLGSTSNQGNPNVGLVAKVAVREFVRVFAAVRSQLESAAHSLVVASITQPGVLLVSQGRVKSAWERLKMDVNSLSATECGIRFSNDSVTVGIAVKHATELCFSELKTEELARHGLALPQAQETSKSPSRRATRSKSLAASMSRSMRANVASMQALGRSDDPEITNDLVDAVGLLAVLRSAPLRLISC